MTVIVSDSGFASQNNPPAAANLNQLDVSSDWDPFGELPEFEGCDLIRIDFPSFADGRGLTLARRLRLAGYSGRLRARGHVLADQYAMARRSGFDEVEISDELAKRQPVEQWLARADWRSHDYQSRLRG